MGVMDLVNEIVECERRLRAAQLASDVGELDALIADELVFVDMAGQIATKEMDLEAHRQGVLKLVESELKEEEIRILNEGAAVAVVRVRLKGNYRGEGFEGEFRYLRVWLKGSEGWRIAAGQMSAVAGV